MARNGKIAIENLAGGELTSAPLLSTPPQYSRRLQNFYINSEGHIKKIPGWSAVSNQVSGVQIRTGIDFKKQDGTSIKLVGGRAGSSGALYRLNSGVLTSVKNDFISLNPLYLSQIGDLIVASNGTDLPVAFDGSNLININMPFDEGAVVFEGSGLNDFSTAISASGETTYEVEVDGVAIPFPDVSHSGTGGKNDLSVPSPNYSGAVATANFDIEIDGTGSGDTIKYNVNGGPYVTGQALTTAAEGLAIGNMRLKASLTIGHNSDDVYEFKVNGFKFTVDGNRISTYQWRKNGGDWSVAAMVPVYPTYAALDADYSLSFNSLFDDNVIDDIFSFQVDGATSPNTFKWRKDSEAYTEGVDIVAGDITLKEGVKVRFKYFTGHTLTDSWTFDVARDTVTYSKDGTPVATGEVITGALQTIQAGVQFKFNAINGHTLGDKWSIPIDVPVRFHKSYPYKNRLWAVGNDRLTAYYSELLQPTNFTSTGSGYIDFRYVIPEGDELLDICATLNYLAFFFRNHVAIYAGTDPTASGDFAIYQNLAGIGVVAAQCVVPVGSDIMFLTPRGVKGLSQVINAGALNVNNVSAAIDSDIIDAINANTSGVYGSSHYQKLGLVLFLIGTSIFIFNYRQNAWSRIVIPSTNDVSKVLSMFTAQDGSLYMGGYDYLHQFDPAVETRNFAGQAPAYRWTGPMWKTTTAESMFFNELLLRLASSAAATLTVKVRAVGFDTQVEDQSAFNEQTIDVPAITTNDAVFNFARIPLYGAGRYVQIDITESPTYDANNDVEIASAEIHGELGIL